MGSGPSKSQQQTQSGPLNRFKNTVNTGITPPQAQPSNIYDLQFILANPPPITLQPQTNTSNNKVKEALDSIKAKIIEYNNKTWNFGNQSDGQPQLLEEKNYNNFLVFVTDLIEKKNTLNQSLITVNAKSFREKQDIVREIHKLVSAGGNKLVNVFFEVEMSEIFPNFPGVKPKDPMMVTLLGLASIIGAEHIVIYLLMIGADQSITKTDNRDSATLMLSFQIGIYKLLQSNPQQQQQPINQKYFIILPRILYILFLLGSIGEGIDLSAIFETNEEKIKENNSTKPKVQLKSSILNMLAQMPGNTSTETARQTLQNGGSIPLLLEILERNNPYSFTPKFFKDVNSFEKPYDLNVLYSVLMNPNIDDETKIKLTELLVLKYNANITNVPTFVGKNTSISIFKIIMLMIDGINFTNSQTKLSILKIFSVSNNEFKVKLERSGLLSKYSKSSSNANKNEEIKRLKAVVALLREKNKLVANRIETLTKGLDVTGIQAAFADTQIDSLVGEPKNLFGTNLRVTQQGQPQGQKQSPGLAQQFPSTNLIQSPVSQLQQIQQPGATLEKKSFGNRLSILKGRLFGKNNKGTTVAQTAPLSSSPQNSLQSPILNPTANSRLSQTVSPLSIQPNLHLSSTPQSSASLNNPLNPTANLSLIPPVSPLSIPSNISLDSTALQSSASLNKPLNNTTSPRLLQPVLQLSSPSNLRLGSTLPQSLASLNKPLNNTKNLSSPQKSEQTKTGFFSGLKNKMMKYKPKKNNKGLQNSNTTITTASTTSPPFLKGGKQIQMRTYHFLKHKKYSERAFIAERPIIAADNAYDFMKLHYDIGSKKITFTIHDRVNNKKYKYTARTLKDGTNVIKSAK